MSLPAPEYTPDFGFDPILDTPAGPDFRTYGDLNPATAPAHETAAVLRMQRSGWKGPEIAKHFGIEPTTLVDQMNAALDAETVATRDRGQAIHDTSAKPSADN